MEERERRQGWRRCLYAGAALWLAACNPAPEAPPLPALGIALDATTVSGFSAGGYMATQYQVAFSGEVKGAGIFAAGPWGCARGRRQLALQDCAGEPTAAPPLPWLLQRLRAAAANGEIAPTAGLADDRVWIFRGTRDAGIAPRVTATLAQFYAALLSPERVVMAPELPAAHALPTETSGTACGVSASPYLAACRVDGVGMMLASITDRALRETTEPGELRKFDQRRYDPDGVLAAAGYVYVPAVCAAASAHCPLHLAFHGCGQGADTIGDTFVREAGYRRAADRLGVVVLFPQVAPSHLAPYNPQGCWDWWGYTGTDHLSRRSPQLSAVHRMAEALALIPAR